MRTDYLRNGIILFIIFLVFAWITVDWGLEFGFADLVLLIVSIYYIIAGLVKSNPAAPQKIEPRLPTTPPIQTQTPKPNVQAPPSPQQQPQPPTPKCPTCGQPLVFVEQYKRWYCPNERTYVLPNTQASPTIPAPVSQTMPPHPQPSTQPTESYTKYGPKAPVVAERQTQADKTSEEDTRLLENLKKKADEGEISVESYNKVKKELRSKKETETKRQELQQELDMLDKRLIEGKISEATYRELKEKFQSKLKAL